MLGEIWNIQKNHLKNFANYSVSPVHGSIAACYLITCNKL